MGRKTGSQTSEVYLWSQRLVDFLHQPSEGATIHGLGQGITCTNRLLETERTDHLEDKYLDFNTKMKTEKGYSSYLSIYKWPLLLWLWVSCEWVPPQGQSHQQPAAAKQQHICSWLHLLPGFGAYLQHPEIQAGLFWPSQDCWSEARWWHKFLPPLLLQTECFQDGGRCPQYWAGSGENVSLSGKR